MKVIKPSINSFNESNFFSYRNINEYFLKAKGEKPNVIRTY